MSKNSYFQLSAVVFSLAGLLHLWRSVNGWELFVGPYLVPAWISWVTVFIAWSLAYHGLLFKK